MSSLELSDLHEADVPQNVALARSVGWKDVESEWRVLHRAGHVRGVRHEGQVVAQGVLGDYGNCASLAKMVVAAAYQGRGLGGRMLDGFLKLAEARHLPVGLCATEQGRPLYASRGFQVSGEIAVLFGEVRAGAPVPATVVTLADAERAVELDARLSGCDRSRVLRARFAEANARLELKTEPGFALALDHGDHTLVGPIVAESEAGARALLLGVARAARGKLRVDVPLSQQGFRSWLVEQGLAEMGHRVEMAWGAQSMPWQAPARFVLASQAWG
ncbi:MAG: GCN5-related N-acetyltransferase [Polyangiaceae bacterium]|jgi:GNAT superfamily N-acetyltransferase|nr:GCN5-related N-acetyltransferase [Polyangiaceae bacterium]